jgi:hypothetical protein
MNPWAVHLGELLLGALIVPPLQGLGFSVRYIYRRICTRYPLEGKWHCYHHTFKKGELSLIHREWHIRKGFRRKYCGAIYEDSKRVYRLRIIEERGTFLFFVRSVDGTETFQVRSTALFTDHQQPSFGLYIALTYDENIFAGMNVLTRNRCSKAQIDEIAARHFRIHTDRPLIVLGDARTTPTDRERACA